jgi:ElaB/YqjD/DUF883 family membrane-anchored ribosome-binding protein
MGQTADQLRQEIDQKRDAAGEKIDQIESRVQDTAQAAKDTVTDTIEQVKQSVDIRQQIEERPLVALGAALVGGFVLGGLVGGDKGDQQHAGQYAGGSPGGSRSGLRNAAKESGLEETLSSMMTALTGMFGERIRSAVDESFPGFAEKMKGSGGQQSSGLDDRRLTAGQPGSVAGSPTPSFPARGDVGGQTATTSTSQGRGSGVSG